MVEEEDAFVTMRSREDEQGLRLMRGIVQPPFSSTRSFASSLT